MWPAIQFDKYKIYYITYVHSNKTDTNPRKLSTLLTICCVLEQAGIETDVLTTCTHILTCILGIISSF